MESIPKTTIQAYLRIFNANPVNRQAIVNAFLGRLDPIIDDEIKQQRLTLQPHEREAEASFALLETIRVYNDAGDFAGTEVPFEHTYLYHLRRCLRRLKPSRSFVDIELVSLEDPNPNPEEQYIQTEQLELIKTFLAHHFKASTIDMFMRRFAEGQTYREIALQHGVTVQTVEEKVKRVLERVAKHMEIMNA